MQRRAPCYCCVGGCWTNEHAVSRVLSHGLWSASAFIWSDSCLQKTCSSTHLPFVWTRPQVTAVLLYTGLLTLPAFHCGFVHHTLGVTLSGWVASSSHAYFSSDGSASVFPCVLRCVLTPPSPPEEVAKAQLRIKYFLSSHLWS